MLDILKDDILKLKEIEKLCRGTIDEKYLVYGSKKKTLKSHMMPLRYNSILEILEPQFTYDSEILCMDVGGAKASYYNKVIKKYKNLFLYNIDVDWYNSCNKQKLNIRVPIQILCDKFKPNHTIDLLTLMNVPIDRIWDENLSNFIKKYCDSIYLLEPNLDIFRFMCSVFNKSKKIHCIHSTLCAKNYIYFFEKGHKLINENK